VQKKSMWVFFALLLIFPLFLAFAQTEMQVEKIGVGTGIQEKELVGADSTFASSVGKVYCFSKILGAEGKEVEQVWYHNDKEVNRVKIAVKYPSYRCWSYKTIQPNQTGTWRVEVVDNEGKVLKSISFTIK
jgi:hypothetical protein